MSKDNRQIRIFISSTFQDMQAERDYLMTKIFPRLRLLAQKRDVSLVEVDLRWGITKEEEGQSGKVVFTCLNEIEQSHPFFLGILGNRYGWCPTEDDLLKNEEFRQRYGWIADDIRHRLSITEIEMQYGVLRNKTPLHAFFFLKRPATGNKPKGFFGRLLGSQQSEEERKLERLKKEIRQNNRYPWAYYTRPDDLGEQVEKAFVNLLDQLYPNRPMTPLEQEQLRQKILRDKQCAVYIETSDLMKEVDEAFASGQSKIGILGDNGIGKSAFIANWLKRHEGDKHIFYHFNEAHDTPESILHHFCIEMESSFQIESRKTEERKNYSDELTQLLAHPSLKNQKIILVVDGLDLLPKDNWAQSLCWLPTAANLQVLLSSVTDSAPAIEMKYCGYQLFELKPLTLAQRSDLTQRYLRMHSKDLEAAQLQRIINDKENENPLVLRTLLDELMVFGCFEQLDERIDYYLRAKSIDDFFERVIKRCEHDYGATMVRKTLTLIAISRKGVDEKTIIELSGIRQLEWSQFYYGIKSHFLSSNGLITFAHHHIRKAVEQLYFSNHNEILEIHQRLGVYLKQQTVEHGKLSDNDIEEISYQLYMGCKWQELYEFMLNVTVQQHMEFHPTEWARYWKALYQVDSQKYSIQALIPIVGNDFVTMLGLCNMITGYLPQEDVTPFTKKIIPIFGADNMVGRMARFKLVQQMEKEGKTDEAISELERLIRETDANDTAYDNYCVEMGALLKNKTEYANAETWFQKTIDHLGPKGLRMPALAHAYYHMGEALILQQRYDDAIEYLQKAFKQYQLTYGKENMGVIHTLSLIASAYCRKKEYQKALHYYQQEMDMCQHLLDPSDNWIKMTLQNMAYVYEQLGEKEQSKRLTLRAELNEVVDIAARFFSLETRAIEYMQNGDPSYAISLFEDFLRSKEFLNEGGALLQARALGNIALCYEQLKQYDQAFEYHKKSAAIADTVTSENIDTIVPVYRNLGIAYFNRNQYEECIEPLKKFIELKKRPKAKPAQEKVNECWQYLWSAYDILTSRCRGKAAYEEAMQWAERMYDVCRERLGIDAPEMGGTYTQLALISEGKGNINEALEYYQQAIDKYSPYANCYPMRLYSIHRFMAELYEKQGQPAEAVNHYAEAIRYLETQDDTTDLPLMYNQLGMVYGRNGQFKESLPYLAKALELAKNEYNDDAYDKRLYPLYYNVGYTLKQLGDLKSAKEYFDFADYVKNK